MTPRPCANPVCPRAAEVGVLCRADYLYRRRTGRLRPESVIVETGRRMMVREIASRLWGPA